MGFGSVPVISIVGRGWPGQHGHLTVNVLQGHTFMALTMTWLC
jgi:hypothetical protein